MVKRPGVLSKVQVLTLVLGVGGLFLLPSFVLQRCRPKNICLVYHLSYAALSAPAGGLLVSFCPLFFFALPFGVLNAVLPATADLNNLAKGVVYPCILRARHNQQNLVVKFDGEICGGVLVENASDDFAPQKKLEKLLPNFAGSSPPISPKTSPTFTLEITGACILRPGASQGCARALGLHWSKRYFETLRPSPKRPL